MKITFLVENNTKVGFYYRGESAFSLLIEDDGIRMLFDAGYTDAFLRNALQMKLDLLNLNYIVLSHGHLDHTWGLDSLTRHYVEAGLQNIATSKPTVIAHPSVFKDRQTTVQIGSVLTEEKLSTYFPVQLDKKPVQLTDKWVFLGEIERNYDFEGFASGTDAKGKPDQIEDDSSLVYKSSNGLVIFTGCAHSGICNTIDYAKKVCGDDRITDIVGGFHLNNASDKQLQGTVNYMKALNPPVLHACHCVDQKSKIALAQVAKLDEVWVGKTLIYT